MAKSCEQAKAELSADLWEIVGARDGNDKSRAVGVESGPEASRRSGKGAFAIARPERRLGTGGVQSYRTACDRCRREPRTSAAQARVER